MLTIRYRRFGVLAICLVALFSTPVVFAQTLYDFNLPPQALADSLRSIGHQTSVNILFDPRSVEKLTAPAVHGQFSASQAVNRILAGTNLAAEQTEANTLLVEPKDKAGKAQAATTLNDPPDDSRKEAGKNSSQDFRVAQVDQGKSSINVPVDKSGEKSKQNKTEGLEEIVVTGTHIRGVSNTPSPVYSFDRDQIDQSGVGSVKDFIERLPQNFNGGVSENTISTVTGGGRFTNVVSGTGVNLRGLGNDATLVLINGHRVAPGDSAGEFVDISMIPLGAVARVEVVPDGASAIYGSDAVAGVVNFILRQDFEGAETRARIGSVSDGSSHETVVGQTVGHAWGDGSALLSYEYYDRTPLSAQDRSYTASAVEPFTLLPEQVRHSAFLNFNQSLNPYVELFADGNFAHRSTYFDIATCVSSGCFRQHRPSEIDGYGGSGGTRIALSNQAHLEFSVSDSHSLSDTQALYNAALVASQKFSTNILSLDAKIDGLLGALPAGDVRFAAGAQYRRESIDDNDLLTPTEFELQRNVSALYLELRVPLVGPGDSAPGQNRLEVNVAGRTEHYSDFGSTTNPQVGLIWAPVGDIKLRGTYGKSFKAPLLSDLNPLLQFPYASPVFDPRTGGTTNAIFELGGNPNLKPEKATTWTLGMDLQPRSIPGVKVSATYYNIRFKDRIVDPSQNIDILDALSLENVLGPNIVQRNPSAALMQQVASAPGYFSDGIPLSAISVLVDSRVQNLSIVDTSGIDLSLAYNVDTVLGHVETGVDGSYTLNLRDQFTPAAPAVSILNTPYNPIGLRMRGRALFSRGPITFSTFVNYTRSYTDNRGEESIPIASWTTVDATLRYEFKESASLLHGLSAILGVTNIGNAGPPFVKNLSPLYPINFDGANANALGRFYSLELTKRW